MLYVYLNNGFKYSILTAEHLIPLTLGREMANEKLNKNFVLIFEMNERSRLGSLYLDNLRAIKMFSS